MVRAPKGQASEKVKVTIKLPKDLVLAGKMRALERGTHLQNLIERGLRQQLRRGR